MNDATKAYLHIYTFLTQEKERVGRGMMDQGRNKLRPFVEIRFCIEVMSKVTSDYWVSRIGY